MKKNTKIKVLIGVLLYGIIGFSSGNRDRLCSNPMYICGKNNMIEKRFKRYYKLDENGDFYSPVVTRMVYDDKGNRALLPYPILQNKNTNVDNSIAYPSTMPTSPSNYGNHITINNFGTDLKKDIQGIDKNRGGIASVVASSNIPQVSSDKLISIGAGLGYYDKHGAIALGISGQDKNKQIIYKITSGVDFKGSFNVGLGLNYSFGKIENNVEKMEIKFPKDLISRLSKLEKENNDLKNRVTKLENAKSMKIVLKDFDLNKYNVKEHQIEKLKNLINLIKDLDETKYIEVIGYTDMKSTERYNLKLGLKRAYSIKELLYKLGLDKTVNVVIKSKGFNEINAGKAKDLRRVEILVNSFDIYK